MFSVWSRAARSSTRVPYLTRSRPGAGAGGRPSCGRGLPTLVTPVQRVKGPAWFSRMTLRGRTVVVGSTVSAVLLLAAAAIPIPYVAVGPGVTYDTLGSVDGTEVISFSGNDIPAPADAGVVRARAPEHDHHLRSPTPFRSSRHWGCGRRAGTRWPRARTISRRTRRSSRCRQQDAQAFQDSQSAAEIASLRYLGLSERRLCRRDTGRLAQLRGAAAAGSDRRRGRRPVTDFPSLQAVLAGDDARPGRRR